MYDSDEVRDAVRRELMRFPLYKSPPSGTTRIEYDAIYEAREAWIAEQVAAWKSVMEALAEALREVAEAVGRTLMEGIAQAIQPALEATKGLAEQLGTLSEATKPAPPPWARRPRKPDIYPVRPIDAVAAGRHPAMIMRTRIRGGRR